MSLATNDYDYALPDGLIADRPAARREDARMMVLDRRAGAISHHRFHEFPGFCEAGDLVVLNDTRVVPARLFSDDGRVELLLLEQAGGCAWKAMVKPGRRMRPGCSVHVAGTVATVDAVNADGTRLVRFGAEPDLDRFGHIPLPPYIRRASDGDDRRRYQTVYASVPGAVAAPTAGLHFTREILAGLDHVFVTLHVGPGTFKPVQAELLADHRMHTERYALEPAAAARINAARRVAAVGTTVVRVLESRAGDDPVRRVGAGRGETGIFIHPPYRFRAVDRLLTNFHLPKSTLLMLVSAFAGREFVLEAYRRAVEERYRFFSYGDCMLIV